MIVTITGNNQYLMRRRLDELTTEFLKDHNELGLQKIDGQETEPAAILEAVQSLPFLASRKMVVVRQASSNKAAADQVEQTIDSAGQTTDLIFYEPNPDKRTSYFKVLKSKTKAEEYNDLDPQSLASWLADEAKKQDGQLSLNDARYLVERVGTGQELLANELEKLITYDAQISRQTIDLLSVKTPQSKVFDLLDAAFGGNKKRALELYDEQRAQKVEPAAILALIAWQLELIALAVYGQGQSANELASRAGVGPYPVQKAQNLARNINKQKLKSMIAEALDIDIKSKTTTLNLDDALKTYITLL